MHRISSLSSLSKAKCSKSIQTSRRSNSSFAYSKSEKENRAKSANVLRLVEGFRKYGHLSAELDPLGLSKKLTVPQLSPDYYCLEGGNEVNLEGILKMGDKKSAKIEEIVNHLKKSYCGPLASQFSSLLEEEKQNWFAKEVESIPLNNISKEEKKKILKLLLEAEVFDHFMQKKFSSVKRYALEGLESTVPALEAVLEELANEGVTDVVITMAHRGRLNILTGLLQFPASEMFWKAKGNSEIPAGVDAIGDVLSHLGQSVDLQYPSGKLHVTLIQNPSHLEASDPVAMGKVFARQLSKGDRDKSKVVCVALHGDAAFTGQGIVTETFGLSGLSGYSVGGTIHIISNNQIGFTTNSNQGRSSKYAADVGKFVDAPLIHVNADCPEEVVKAAKISAKYRGKFKSDVIVDLIGYRRHGHNELDEPSFTQPLMYKNVRARESVVQSYSKKLQEEGIVTKEEVDEMRKTEDERLNAAFKEMKEPTKSRDHFNSPTWKNFKMATDSTLPIKTGVKKEVLQEVAKKSVEIPAKTVIHPRLEKGFVQARNEAIEKDKIDWATGESMAFASLLKEGFNVRISGQDVSRGTFSHRHLELTDQETGDKFIPLNNVGKGKIYSVNSSLSEAGVMGFEYGYSIEDPNTLPIWEAQFGDFANSAQIVIDTFVTCGETKWLKQSGLVLMLPHGYDGAGPEHSSGRMERFLQMVESDAVNLENPRNSRPNFHLINPTTPSNIFHALRRQMKRDYRLPLVVMGPKTLIRSAKAVSKLSDFEEGTNFLPVISDSSVDANNVKRVIFISGKFYYDVEAERAKKGDKETAIVRIEELAPFPLKEIKAEIAKYSNAKKFDYAQDENQNSGAWLYLQPRLQQLVPKIIYIGKPPCAATAVGTGPEYKKQVADLLNSLFP